MSQFFLPFSLQEIFSQSFSAGLKDGFCPGPEADLVVVVVVGCVKAWDLG